MAAKIRIATLKKRKEAGEKIVMITAYDYPTGRLADEAGVEVVLVGDSLGNAVLGFEDTIPVTLDHMVHHTAAVRRGVRRALVVADMPFMTYKITPEEALRNAARLVREGGAEAVKLEGGREVAPTVCRIVESGIPVMGHLGLTPQSIHALSGYRVRGKTDEGAQRLVEDALALQEAGCFAVVLECLPTDLAREITEKLAIPLIGIGAGEGCDGQVLVLCDLLGLSFGKVPRFVKPYAQVGEIVKEAIENYAREVRRGDYPDPEHSYGSRAEEKVKAN